MNTPEFADRIEHFFAARPVAEQEVVETLPGFFVLRFAQTTTLEATVYNPLVCLVLQGRKEAHLGDRVVDFGPGESLIVSHDLAVVTRVTEASPDTPYLAVALTLDLGVLVSLYEQVGEAAFDRESAHSLDAGQADPALVDVLGRYFALADDPLEAKVMAPLILREAHFRLLMAPHGGMLRRLLRHDSHASNISRAITRIREGFRSRLIVPDLAREVGMSESSFHKHFKAVTATTPLQYQKELRLIEAQRLLMLGAHSVSAAAFEVGYESPTQFSREYTRKFGAPPRAEREAALSV